MRRAATVLTFFLVLAGSLATRPATAQAPRGRTPIASTRGFDFDRDGVSPVRPEMYIPFYLEEKLFEGTDSVAVSMRIYNVLNNVVAIPVLRDPMDGRQARNIGFIYYTPGKKVAYWDGKDLAGRTVTSGIFYCKLTVGGESTVVKLVVDSPVRRRSLIPWR
ncbi:MAG: hypothetical protein KY464_10875 [Gemmatimonadetes bacterium]|nr:hypothetical protein [Gemmatimonadota bacterium]